MLIPRYYQKNAKEKFFEYTSSNHGKHPLIVLSTGAGKSMVIAMIIEEMLKWDHTKILILQHSKHLLTQNANELTNLLNDRLLDIGVYSAGLNSRDSRNRILFAGIQSIHDKAWSVAGYRDLILVDEAHHISVKSEGSYRKFLDQMIKINPKIVIGGLSATPWRTKGGLLCDPYHKDKIFDDICYEVTIPELINPNHPKNMDKTQYLCPLISPQKAMKSKVDLSNVHVVAGEYNLKEMESSFNKDDLIERTVEEIISYVPDRKKVIIFCAGIEHCEAVYDTFIRHGFTADRVHSKRTKDENEKAMNDFAKGNIKFLLNINSLTEGYNVKDIDCIAILRATMSPGLWVQMCGRGLRLHPSKENTLILDFGENCNRLGSIDSIEIKKQKDGTSRAEGAPQKVCPNCESQMALAVMICPDCGYIFPQKDKHEDEASEADIISKWKKPMTYDVSYVDYQVHSKAGSPDCLRVKYYVGDLVHYDEYVCPLHQGFAQKKAKRWLDQRLPVERLDEPLYTIEDIVKNRDKISEPVQILVDHNGKYPQITGFLFKKIEAKETEDVRAEATI